MTLANGSREKVNSIVPAIKTDLSRSSETSAIMTMNIQDRLRQSFIMKVIMPILMIGSSIGASTHELSDCVRCEKILRLCSPPCPNTETCVVTRQTCYQCGTPYCIPNDRLSAFCDLNPVAICLDPEENEGLCAERCKKD